jgi:hypothetical protein
MSRLLRYVGQIGLFDRRKNAGPHSTSRSAGITLPIGAFRKSCAAGIADGQPGLIGSASPVALMLRDAAALLEAGNESTMVLRPGGGFPLRGNGVHTSAPTPGIDEG